MPSIFPNLLAGTKITDPLKLARVGPNSLTLLNWKSLSYAFFVLRRKIPAKSDTNTFLVSHTNTVTSKLYFPHLLLQEPMEEFKMESFHPAEPLVASELPSPLVSKPPKEFADETSSTASEAATSASAAATVATIDHHHHHHHHPVGNVSFFCIKSLLVEMWFMRPLLRSAEDLRPFLLHKRAERQNAKRRWGDLLFIIVFWPWAALENQL